MKTVIETSCQRCKWQHDPAAKSQAHLQAAKHTTDTGHPTATTQRKAGKDGS